MLEMMDGERMTKLLLSIEGWFPTTLLRLSIKTSVIVNISILQLPGTTKKNSLHPKMKLIAVLCLNDIQQQRNFSRHYQNTGKKEEKEKRKDIKVHINNQKRLVVRSKVVQYKLIQK